MKKGATVKYGMNETSQRQNAMEFNIVHTVHEESVAVSTSLLSTTAAVQLLLSLLPFLICFATVLLYTSRNEIPNKYLFVATTRCYD